VELAESLEWAHLACFVHFCVWSCVLSTLSLHQCPHLCSLGLVQARARLCCVLHARLRLQREPTLCLACTSTSPLRLHLYVCPCCVLHALRLQREPTWLHLVHFCCSSQPHEPREALSRGVHDSGLNHVTVAVIGPAWCPHCLCSDVSVCAAGLALWLKKDAAQCSSCARQEL
jgi:hypothetical protein